MRFRIRYPKFLLLAASFIIAYFLFQKITISGWDSAISSSGYLGAFIAGIFYAYGFTAAPAAAIFLILGKGQNLLFTGLIGGLGSLCGDYLIFMLIRTSFEDEIFKLEKEKLVKKFNKHIPIKFKHYLLMLTAELFIASPLPDEIGVALLSIDRKVSRRTFIIISYLLNTLGILIIMAVGSWI